MIFTIFLVLLLLIFPFFFPGSYAGELLISFLPYLTGIALLFALISFVHFRKRMRPGYHHVRRYFRGISFLAFSVIFFSYSGRFRHFYVNDPLPGAIQSGDIKVLYANIHKDNTEYSGIMQTITATDPDLIMFVEFSDHHYAHLKEFLQKEYPYTNSTSRSKTFVGSMVFSKYPIDNRADDFPQGSRRYGYFSLLYSGHEIYFSLVHTSSPDSYDHFVMRNQQLKTFVQDFEKHENANPQDDIVVVGDFNITPRSSYYPILSDAFSGTVSNVTQHIPFLFTRRFKELPLFFAHIDHLRTSPALQVSLLKILPIPGSDHKAFFFSFQPK